MMVIPSSAFLYASQSPVTCRVTGLISNLQTTTNLSQALIDVQLTPSVVNNPLFPEPNGPNVTINVFNVTSNVNTDVEFRCLDQATAFSAVNHNLFESVWFYEFNRSYQTPGFSPNVSLKRRPHIDVALRVPIPLFLASNLHPTSDRRPSKRRYEPGILQVSLGGTLLCVWLPSRVPALP